jgi:ferrous iron transport protein B
MEFILVGQPNSGKSTIFNSVVGYKSVVSNFPGVTVSYTQGKIYLNNKKIDVVDIPGTYSLQTSDEAELVAVEYLMKAPEEVVIINIVDASVLSRSLELTLQLMELKRPMVIVLNMMDEAERKGIIISCKKLSDITGVPVIETIGRKGKGVFNVFKEAYKVGKERTIPRTIEGPFELEKLISRLVDFLKVKNVPQKWNYRFISIKLLERDPLIKIFLKDYFSQSDWKFIDKNLAEIEKTPRKSSEFIIASVRHNMAFKIFEDTSRVGHPSKMDIREKIDSLLMHPILGYVFMVGALYLTFSIVFGIGDVIEPLFSGYFEKLSEFFASHLKTGSLLFSVIDGIVQGFGGGLGIVIPYLLPFFIVLSFLEDSGYLARIAYLIDNLMHRIGLHGMSVVPMVLGYGCTVPAIMATRILKSRRDKLITATLTTMVPCSARMIIILGVAGSISMGAAGLVYIINIIVLGITGKIMSMAMPEVSPGLLLEIPKYHLPGFKAVLNKTWFRMKEFVIIAWPLLILGSILLEIIKYFNLSGSINTFLSPFTSGILGLPAVVGVVLLFGILRKELALILLITALGTKEIQNVMTATQIFTFTIFATFYIPCLATFAVLAKELKWRNAFLITAITIIIAVVLSVFIRFVFPLFI